MKSIPVPAGSDVRPISPRARAAGVSAISATRVTVPTRTFVVTVGPPRAPEPSVAARQTAAPASGKATSRSS